MSTYLGRRFLKDFSNDQLVACVKGFKETSHIYKEKVDTRLQGVLLDEVVRYLEAVVINRQRESERKGNQAWSNLADVLSKNLNQLADEEEKKYS